MRRVITVIISIFMLFFVAGCANDTVTSINRMAEYGEKTLEAELPLKLNVECACSNIEIYSWNKQQVKFEFTKSITGYLEKQKLEKYLKEMKIYTDVSGSKVSFTSTFEKSDKIRSELELRVYIPYRIEEVSISCSEGKLRVCDHLKCSLLITGGILDTTINKISGRLNASIEKGNVRISAGKLLDGTIISTEDGNVYVKTLYEPSGEYSIYSGTGALDINIPKELNARIIDYLPADYYDNNTKEDYVIEAAGSDTASFRLTSGIEEVSVTRY